MPELDNTVLLVEDDEMPGEAFFKEFDRNLQSLLHCCKNKKINGIIISIILTAFMIYIGFIR